MLYRSLAISRKRKRDSSICRCLSFVCAFIEKGKYVIKRYQSCLYRKLQIDVLSFFDGNNDFSMLDLCYCA